jgi:hypothetical protein
VFTDVYSLQIHYVLYSGLKENKSYSILFYSDHRNLPGDEHSWWARGRKVAGCGSLCSTRNATTTIFNRSRCGWRRRRRHRFRRRRGRAQRRRLLFRGGSQRRQVAATSVQDLALVVPDSVDHHNGARRLLFRWFFRRWVLACAAPRLPSWRKRESTIKLK